MRRNAAIAMGNSGRKEFVAILETLSKDPEVSVAESAAWALRRLNRGETARK
jgi:epoxyqueuosine reductase QueG